MILIKWAFAVIFVINAHFLLIIICFVLIFCYICSRNDFVVDFTL